MKIRQAKKILTLDCCAVPRELKYSNDTFWRAMQRVHQYKGFPKRQRPYLYHK